MTVESSREPPPGHNDSPSIIQMANRIHEERAAELRKSPWGVAVVNFDESLTRVVIAIVSRISLSGDGRAQLYNGARYRTLMDERVSQLQQIKTKIDNNELSSSGASFLVAKTLGLLGGHALFFTSLYGAVTLSTFGIVSMLGITGWAGYKVWTRF